MLWANSLGPRLQTRLILSIQGRFNGFEGPGTRFAFLFGLVNRLKNGGWSRRQENIQNGSSKNMSVLFIAIPVALVVSLIAVIAFVSQVRNGQFDDLETPPRRVLFDDVDFEGGDSREH